MAAGWSHLRRALTRCEGLGFESRCAFFRSGGEWGEGAMRAVWAPATARRAGARRCHGSPAPGARSSPRRGSRQVAPGPGPGRRRGRGGARRGSRVGGAAAPALRGAHRVRGGGGSGRGLRSRAPRRAGARPIRRRARRAQTGDMEAGAAARRP